MAINILSKMNFFKKTGDPGIFFNSSNIVLSVIYPIFLKISFSHINYPVEKYALYDNLHIISHILRFLTL